MTKSVVITLILFIVFCGVCIGFSTKLVKNQWILREAREKLSHERATLGAHDWKLKSRARLSFLRVSHR